MERGMIDCGRPGRIERDQRPFPVSDNTQNQTGARIQKNGQVHSRHVLELASEAAGIGSFTWWIPEGVIEASPELERLWGLASGTSETHPEFWTSRLVESDRQHGEAVWGQWKAQRPEDCALDFRIVTPDGGPKWMHLRAKWQYAAAGQLRCMIGINLDITAHKQAEEALRRSEFWFRTLADNVPEVLY